MRACLGEPTPAFGHPSKEGIIQLSSLCRVAPVLSLSKPVLSRAEGGRGGFRVPVSFFLLGVRAMLSIVQRV